MNQYDKDRDSNKLTCDRIEVKPDMSGPHEEIFVG